MSASASNNNNNTVSGFYGDISRNIESKLKESFEPTYLEIHNESSMHNVPKNSETHFKVIVISNKFQNIRVLERHRLINQVLSHELEHGVHALSIIARTPDKWDKKNKSNINKSPPCLGGSNK